MTRGAVGVCAKAAVSETRRIAYLMGIHWTTTNRAGQGAPVRHTGGI
jgi:hypothetical protein